MAVLVELVDDLTTLSEIDEDIILDQLRERFAQDKIYTLVGDVLIAVNPYKHLDIYHHHRSQPSKVSAGGGGGAAVFSPSAHVYSIAALAYRELSSADADQCFVISGESGAGKTETCKYIIKHLTELSSGDHGLEQRIMQTNPLLEAFGNAKTSMNNNSSRFGKYLQLKFVRGKMIGAKVNEYLLEKSRVVKQGEGETNFHIFYWLLDGLDEATLDKLHLKRNGHFKYVESKNESKSAENVRMFQQLKDCFDLVGFREDEQYSVLVCLAAILHLGNIEVIETDHGFADINDSDQSLIIAAQHLGIDKESLKQLLTVSVSLTKLETIQKHLSKTKAEAARDAVAKATYDRLFRWVVNQINRLLAADIKYTHEANEIGILDIFGFENFKLNSFEQLCINIANEKLHQFFIDHIFQQEMAEYSLEGIKGIQFTVEDNSCLLSAFLSGLNSVFSTLDEQNFIPGANDVSFLTKINNNLKKERFYVPPKSTSQGRFIIRHYAGEVKYSVHEFLDKNTDPLPAGARGILQSSDNQLISLLFRASISSTGTLCLNRSTWSKISRSNIHKNPRRGAKAQSNTISLQFKHSLNSLVSKMSSAVPHFIRCLKPNTNKVPGIFDGPCVKRQLAYTGIADTVRIRRDGYGYRPTFDEFNTRFTIDTPLWTTDADIQCQVTLAECGIQPDQYIIGQTKLFLKHYHLTVLNEHVRKKESSAILIQAAVRGYTQKCKYARLLEEKQKQEALVEQLMKEISQSSNSSVAYLENIVQQDEHRLEEEKRKSELLQLKLKCPPLPPPTGLYELPPPPKIESDDEEDVDAPTVIIEEEDNHLMKSLELIQISPPDQPKRQSYQSRILQSSTSVSFTWLFGMLSQNKAEHLLGGRPPGTFLVRVNRKKLTYILSYKCTSDGFRHINVTQLPNMKFVLSGETAVHSSLEELVTYYTQNPIHTTGDKLLYHYNEEDDDLTVTISGDQMLSV